MIASSSAKPHNSATTKTSQQAVVPEQQKTPSASPIMDKAGVSEQSQRQQHSSSRNNVSDLLGSQFASWPFSETSLIHAINLKAEQEKTKQEYYKLENTNRSLELLKHSIAARIPPDSIPLIFAGQSLTKELAESLTKERTSTAPSSNDLPLMQAIPSVPPQQPAGEDAAAGPRTLHERSATISTPKDFRRQQQTANEFSTPPMPLNFKFGGDRSEAPTPQSAQQNPPLTQPVAVTPPHRINTNHNNNFQSRQKQLSPAKMGAQAVASLNSRFRNYHNRTASLPPQVSIPESSAVNFHREEKALPKVPTVKAPQQDKPVILQHQLIQFHHWTPSESETTPNKRRRSDEGDVAMMHEKSINELKDDNMNERRKFITSHTRSRSEIRADQLTKKEIQNENDGGGSRAADPPKYPNILSE